MYVPEELVKSFYGICLTIGCKYAQNFREEVSTMIWELIGSRYHVNKPAKINFGVSLCTIVLENIFGRNGIFLVFGVQICHMVKIFGPRHGI